MDCPTTSTEYQAQCCKADWYRVKHAEFSDSENTYPIFKFRRFTHSWLEFKGRLHFHFIWSKCVLSGTAGNLVHIVWVTRWEISMAICLLSSKSKAFSNILVQIVQLSTDQGKIVTDRWAITSLEQLAHWQVAMSVQGSASQPFMYLTHVTCNKVRTLHARSEVTKVCNETVYATAMCTSLDFLRLFLTVSALLWCEAPLLVIAGTLMKVLWQHNGVHIMVSFSQSRYELLASSDIVSILWILWYIDADNIAYVVNYMRITWFFAPGIKRVKISKFKDTLGYLSFGASELRLAVMAPHTIDHVNFWWLVADRPLDILLTLKRLINVITEQHFKDMRGTTYNGFQYVSFGKHCMVCSEIGDSKGGSLLETSVLLSFVESIEVPILSFVEFRLLEDIVDVCFFRGLRGENDHVEGSCIGCVLPNVFSGVTFFLYPDRCYLVFSGEFWTVQFVSVFASLTLFGCYRLLCASLYQTGAAITLSSGTSPTTKIFAFSRACSIHDQLRLLAGGASFVFSPQTLNMVFDPGVTFNMAQLFHSWKILKQFSACPWHIGYVTVRYTVWKIAWGTTMRFSTLFTYYQNKNSVLEKDMEVCRRPEKDFQRVIARTGGSSYSDNTHVIQGSARSYICEGQTGSSNLRPLHEEATLAALRRCSCIPTLFPSKQYEKGVGTCVFYSVRYQDALALDCHTSKIAVTEPGMKLCNYVCLFIIEALGGKSLSEECSYTVSEVRIFTQGVIVASFLNVNSPLPSTKILSEGVSYVACQSITTITSLFAVLILWRIAWKFFGKVIKK